MSDRNQALYVTVTYGMRGYFAVLIDESDGFPEPVNTGIGSYDTPERAKVEAKAWANAEGLEFRE